jgi:hypothetical protein
MRQSLRRRPSLHPIAIAAALVFSLSPARSVEVVWTGPDNGYWDDAANWDVGLPGIADNLVLGSFNTEFRSGAVSVLSFLGTGQLTVSGGSLSFSAASSVGALSFTGGNLGGSGDLSVSGPSSWSGFGSQMSGTGSTTFSGALALSGDGYRIITERTVNFAGTTTWSTSGTGNNGFIYTGSGAVLNNSGTFNDDTVGNTSINNGYGGAASTFINSGTYTKSGAGTTNIAIAFNNGGAVAINAGTLSLSGGGTSSGSFAGGGTLAFAGGTHDLDASSSVSTANVTFSGGTANLGGGFSVAGTTNVTGGTVNFNGTVANLGGSLLVSGGTANFNNTADVVYSTLEFSGGLIGGDRSLTVSGPSSWTGFASQMVGTGSTTFNGTLALSGDGYRIITERTVNFANTTTWTNVAGSGYNGLIYTGSGATLNNSSSFRDDTSVDTSINNGYGGAQSTFINSGSYTKSGASRTNIDIAFDNSGAVTVNAGTLALGGGGTSSGTFNVASGATLALSGGTHTLNGLVAGTGTGRLLVSGGTVEANGVNAFGGQLAVSGGQINTNGSFSAAGFDMTGGTVGGTGALTISGPSSWTGFNGQMAGTGSTTFNGALALSGDGYRVITERTVNFANTTTWTNVAGSGYNGLIYTGSGATLNNSSSFRDDTSVDTSINNGYGGAQSTFINSGSYTKSGASRTDIGIAFNNSGVVTVNAGTLSLSGGLTNFSGTTLSGGTYNVVGNSVLQFVGADIVTNAATIVLDGANSALLDSNTGNNALTNFSTNAAGASFTLRNGRQFTRLSGFSNSGIVNIGSDSRFEVLSGGFVNNGVASQLQLAGGSLAQSGGEITNQGLITGFGSVTPAINNTGRVVASGGTLQTFGVFGSSGYIGIEAGASMSLNSFSSNSVGTLLHQGVLLNLGSNPLTVHTDYDNAGFGVGNAFNRRANVTGGGQIRAAGTTQQTLAGAAIVNGNTANATLALGNQRVGQGGVSSSFTIGNTGTGGPSLRGALQNTGITNTALSGSGVTAQNWGAVAQGGSTAAFTVTFNPLTGGALQGQTLQVVNNFDNVAGQTLTITGAAYNLASASAITPNPVVLANQRVGGVLSQALSITNNAALGGFSERLNATIAANGTAIASGSFDLLAAGASSSALQVGVDTSTAGAKGGIATITLASDGTGTSGFAALGLGAQQVNVSGNVYRLATGSVTPDPIAFGNVRVGDAAQSFLSVSNTAAADGFSERLNAGFSGSTGSATTGAGTAVLVAAGASNSASMSVTLNTLTAGAKAGTVTVAFESDGAGTSGFAGLANGSQTLAFSGGVYSTALPSFAATSVNLGNARVGQTVQQALSVGNTVNAPTGYQERLNALAGGSTAGITASGGFTNLGAGATNNTSLLVGLDTSSAGAKSGTASVGLVSSGLGTSGLADLALGSQSIAISGNVFRLASASAVAPVVLAAQRVGGGLTQALTLSNTAANDGFSERLNASLSTSGQATGSGGPVSLLAAGATSSALLVGVNTATAGAKTGTATVTLASDGAGTSGFSAFGLGTQQVSVSGNVYASAVATLNTPTVDFGIVRVGDVVAARNVSVSNTTSGALTDTLRATLSGGGVPFSASGTAAAVAAGGTDAGSLSVTLDTSAAGVFSQSANVAFTSQNAEMADLALGNGTVGLLAQVNNLAAGSFAKASGNGSFSGGGVSYVLDFGSFVQGSSSLAANLSLLNGASGPADDLAGSFDLSGLVAGGAFTVTGMGPFSGLAAGDSIDGLQISFGSGTLGSFDSVIVLSALSTNASDPTGLALGDIELRLQGTVVAVPEPGTWVLMVGGLLLLARVARRRNRLAA